MKIQFASDLHLEFPDNRSFLKETPIIPVADVLILNGDIICDKYKKRANKFYDLWKKQFKLIISTMGNHEFYHGTIDYAFPTYKKQLAENHYLLNNSSIVYDHVKFIVSTLWSYIPEKHASLIEKNMNDYGLISRIYDYDRINISSTDTNAFHNYSVQFIEKELADNFNGKIVVATHHLPNFACLFTDKEISPLQYAYASDLNYLLKKHHIDLWIFGHQHKTVDIELYNCRLLSNPLGYFDEEQKEYFKRDWVVTV